MERYGSNSWIMDSKRITEKRREEIAAPAIVARINTLRRDWMLSEDCFDMRVTTSIVRTLQSTTMNVFSESSLRIFVVNFAFAVRR
jgi:hypothetical protein